MKYKAVVPITVQQTIMISCFGCDFQKDEVTVVRKGFLGILKQEYVKYVCTQLKIQLPSRLMDLMYDMSKAECPCHFEKWQQTNPDLGDFVDVPVFRFTLQGDDTIKIKSVGNALVEARGET